MRDAQTRTGTECSFGTITKKMWFSLKNKSVDQSPYNHKGHNHNNRVMIPVKLIMRDLPLLIKRLCSFRVFFNLKKK